MNLSAIRQAAKDKADEQSTTTSGIYSNAWWNRLINLAQSILSEQTGYYRAWQGVSTGAGRRSYDLPSALGARIEAAQYDGEDLDIVDIQAQKDTSPSWRADGEEGTPERLVLTPPSFDLDPMPDRTVTYAARILSAAAGAAFTNQPANDGVEIVSNSGSDTQTMTIYGTTFRTNTVVAEAIVLTGTTAVSTVKTDWEYILGVEIDSAAVGTITVREASANQTITTITAGNTSSGVTSVVAADQWAGKAQPIMFSAGAFTTIPSLDGIEAVSSGADTRTVKLIGTTYNSGDLSIGYIATETVTLTGATFVSSSKTDWGRLLAAVASAAHGSNTITIHEASADVAITTIAANATTSGGTSTAIVGIVGTDEDGAAITDNAIELSGDTMKTVTFPKRMETVTKALLGAAAATTHVWIVSGAALTLLGPTAPADLSADTDTPEGLPDDFHSVLVDGAVALSEQSDMVSGDSKARQNISSGAFGAGISAVRAYVESMSTARHGAVRVESSAYREHFD